MLDLTKNNVKLTSENVIAVMTDNTNDASYPPGKPEYTLDCNYDGGIYRDSWLIATNDVHITDANAVNKVASGGVLVHYENVSEKAADVVAQTDIVNEGTNGQQVSIDTYLEDGTSKTVAKTSQQRALICK